MDEDMKELEKVVGLQTDKPLTRIHAIWRNQDGRAGMHDLWV